MATTNLVIVDWTMSICSQNYSKHYPDVLLFKAFKSRSFSKWGFEIILYCILYDCIRVKQFKKKSYIQPAYMLKT